jgi:exodeoxyribonuclease-3
VRACATGPDAQDHAQNRLGSASALSPQPSALSPQCASSASTPTASAPRRTRISSQWLKKQKADVVCLQETKAQEDQLSDPAFRPDGHHCFYRDATTKKGYSGVAIYSRREPDEVRTKLGWAPFDDEGRYLEARYGNLSVVSLYVPSGSSGEERQQFKFKVMDWIAPILRRLAGERPRVRDLAATGTSSTRATTSRTGRRTRRTPAACPRNAPWLDSLFKRGWVDSFRALKPDAVEYTWWSNRGAARANNVGWRIDYQIVSPALRARLKSCAITPSPRFSDHAPYVVDYAVRVPPKTPTNIRSGAH